jgi:hypothetical protein
MCGIMDGMIWGRGG